MQKSSIIGSIFIGLFGVPFFGMGSFFAMKSVQGALQGVPGAYVGVGMGALFACIGLGLMALGVASYRFGQRQAAMMSANPGTPWMWREDWAAGRSDGRNTRAYIGLWIFAFLWDAISFPAAALAFPKLMGDVRLLIVMIFPVVGFILTGAAVLSTLRAKRYGRTSFWFASNPFTPGRKLGGFIHLRMPVAAEHGVDVRLSCIRQVTTGSGKSRSTTDTIVWQEERNIPGSALTRMNTDVQVPVEFNIPIDAALTNSDNPNDKLLWKLHAQADVPGVDFKDDYEVPVFRTANQSATATPSTDVTDEGAQNRDSLAPARRTFAAPESEEKVADEPIVVPSRTHIVITEDGANTSVYFPPLRNPAQAFGLFAFTVIWTAVVYLLFTREAPTIFRVVFGAAEILLGYGLLNVIFGSSLIRVGQGSLSIRTAIMGIGSTKTMPLDGVQSVSPVSQGQADASGEAKFGIFVQLTDGRVFKVAASSLSRTEARWIVAAIDRGMGRKEEATPKFEPIVMGMPAQSSGVGVVRVGGVSTSKIGRAIGIAFFIGWLFFVGRFAFHFSGAFSKRPQTTGQSEPAPSRGPVPVSMSEEDVSRVLSMPTQQQAEELLERSIRHDEHALQLLQERVDGWTSKLHETDRMKRLGEQARYSTDLRVRQMNEDIELAMDGWHKDSDAVDLLIGRAKSDPQYKAAALYFLGMEGGRGMETQHVYEVLREYALHDPDATSRQWAVEGLRFLQTDEALDTLWESFTTDPSFAVRNRAGCNLSDCGLFTREQRMRTVPKLLAILNDSSLNPQMRGWCYMALRGITGASLPEDPAAWNRWYSEHGSETMAQFQREPWYQVRGDQ